MASGACQKNISQPTILNLPIPEILLNGDEKFVKLFEEFEKESKNIIKQIEDNETKLTELKKDISTSVRTKIFEFYSE
jgi:restriction endonuclease S subunit